ncbi:unnamed protein product, partial [Gulo gulo]
QRLHDSLTGADAVDEDVHQSEPLWKRPEVAGPRRSRAGAAEGKVSEGRWIETEWDFCVCAFFSMLCFSRAKEGTLGQPCHIAPAAAGHCHPPTHEAHTRSLVDGLGPVL